LHFVLEVKDVERMEPAADRLQMSGEDLCENLGVEGGGVFKFPDPSIFDDGYDKTLGIALRRFVRLEIRDSGCMLGFQSGTDG
jgi:hypothetical protein